MPIQSSIKPKEPEKMPSQIEQLLGRLGAPACIFSGTLFALVLLLSIIMAPERFPIHLQGNVVQIKELKTEVRRLKTLEASLREQRLHMKSDDASVLSSALATAKASILPVGRIFMEVERTRAMFGDAIALPHVVWTGNIKTLVIGGVLKDPNGRSIQLLAAFVDGLRAIEGVVSVSEPEYTTSREPSGVSTTPFQLTIIVS